MKNKNYTISEEGRKKIEKIKIITRDRRIDLLIDILLNDTQEDPLEDIYQDIALSIKDIGENTTVSYGDREFEVGENVIFYMLEDLYLVGKVMKLRPGQVLIRWNDKLTGWIQSSYISHMTPEADTSKFDDIFKTSDSDNKTVQSKKASHTVTNYSITLQLPEGMDKKQATLEFDDWLKAKQQCWSDDAYASVIRSICDLEENWNEWLESLKHNNQ